MAVQIDPCLLWPNHFYLKYVALVQTFLVQHDIHLPTVDYFKGLVKVWAFDNKVASRILNILERKYFLYLIASNGLCIRRVYTIFYKKIVTS